MVGRTCRQEEDKKKTLFVVSISFFFLIGNSPERRSCAPQCVAAGRGVLVDGEGGQRREAGASPGSGMRPQEMSRG